MATGQEIGYCRVSTADQSTERQLVDVTLDRTFTDHASGRDTSRVELLAALAYLREGDTLHVHSMDRLARNLADLRKIVNDLTARGVKVQFHKENLIFTGEDSPMSDLLLSLLGAVAEFERSMILERTREGIAIAKAAGRYKGRKPTLSRDQAIELKRLINEGVSKSAVAHRLGISRATVYEYLKLCDEAIAVLAMPIP